MRRLRTESPREDFAPRSSHVGAKRDPDLAEATQLVTRAAARGCQPRRSSSVPPGTSAASAARSSSARSPVSASVEPTIVIASNRSVPSRPSHASPQRTFAGMRMTLAALPRRERPADLWIAIDARDRRAELVAEPVVEQADADADVAHRDRPSRRQPRPDPRAQLVVEPRRFERDIPRLAAALDVVREELGFGHHGGNRAPSRNSSLQRVSAARPRSRPRASRPGSRSSSRAPPAPPPHRGTFALARAGEPRARADRELDDRRGDEPRHREPHRRRARAGRARRARRRASSTSAGIFW